MNRRKAFQGLSNVIYFNWPFYAFSLVIIFALISVDYFLTGKYEQILVFLYLIVSAPVLSSIVITSYIYDFSDLYKMNWIKGKTGGKFIYNIHAGFDEASEILRNKFPESSLKIYSFYDVETTTEPSIRRARKRFPILRGTEKINIPNLHWENSSVDKIVLFLAAHEIRERNKRIEFFKVLKNSIKSDGTIYVTEHLRDINNFVAYTMGAFHFLSEKEWEITFREAGLIIEKRIKTTAFITTFILNILKKNDFTA